MEAWIPLGYLLSAALFIFGLKKLGHPRTAPRGNQYGAMGMLVAVITTVVDMQLSAGGLNWELIVAGLVVGSVIGAIMAVKVEMTGMPELVALFNGFGGSASALVALSETWKYIENPALDLPSGLTLQVVMVAAGLSALVGWMTLTGSILAMFKLKGGVQIFGKWFSTPTWGPTWLNPVKILLTVSVLALIVMSIQEPRNTDYLWAIIGISCLLGIVLVLPIGGADMPVVISLLNSYSGLAACAAGFAINNNILIVAGSMVGAAGIILTNIMCKAMNRSLANVLFSGFGAAKQATKVEGEVKPITADDAFLILEAAQSVSFVPGYGMAVAQAQHVVRELGELLEKNGAEVSYAIHPVAGRMPGHMNVLLAEANVPYDQLVEMEDINPRIDNVDVAVVIGANDVVNPAARNDENSPIYGMPIINVDQARTVFVLKRSMASGFSGVDNPLFFGDNTRMLFGDAKQSIASVVAEFKG